MTKAHPITVEVVRNAVVAYADEMANVLAKSAYNMMIYEVRDYCCGLLDVKGRMISQNRGGLPIFLADLGPAVEDGIQRYKGLSEIDAKELWETRMDPSVRVLRQITLDDAAAADELFSILMGEDVEARRSFITRNARDVRFLDV